MSLLVGLIIISHILRKRVSKSDYQARKKIYIDLPLGSSHTCSYRLRWSYSPFYQPSALTTLHLVKQRHWGNWSSNQEFYFFHCHEPYVTISLWKMPTRWYSNVRYYIKTRHFTENGILSSYFTAWNHVSNSIKIIITFSAEPKICWFEILQKLRKSKSFYALEIH